MEIGGVTPGSQCDQLVVDGNTQLGGRLDIHLINGFIPQPGDSFTVLACSSRTGTFSRITGAPDWTMWLPQYTSTGVTLTLAKVVGPAKPTVAGGMLSFGLNTIAGAVYVVQKTDSINPVNWQTLTSFQGDGNVKIVSDPATQPQRDHRVVVQ